MKIRKDITCPLEHTHDLMRGKWKCIIVFNLRHAPLSLSELQKSINGISQKMLLHHLNELRDCGAVDKVNAEGYPLRVEYFLTGRGKKMLEAVQIMQEIGIEIFVEQGRTALLDERGIDYGAFMQE